MNATRLILPLALLAALAAACATLRVDVDVYTGPLADHEDIQAERMAVMAIGAKPLLIELRDRLEKKARDDKWPDLNQEERDLIGDRREFGPGQNGYKAKYIQVEDSPKSYRAWSTLIDTKARRVNAVLWLYEDTLNPELAPYLRNGLQSYEDYKESQDILKSPEAKQWQDRLQARAADPAVGEIARAYVRFFDRQIFVYDVINRANAQYKRNYPTLEKDPDRRIDEQSTLYFTDLVQDKNEIVSNHAGFLYPDAGERACFIRAVKERAAAFLSTRRALEGLFSLSLIFLRDISEEPLQSTTKNREQLVSIVSDMAASILTAGYLTKLKECCDNQAPTCPDCKEIAGLTEKLSGSKEEVKSRVKSLLRTQTHDTAVQLLAAHTMVKQGFCINPDPFAAQFGATLFKADKGGPTPEQLLAALDDMSCLVSATGLDRGRGPWGLERLIEEYLNAAQDFTAKGCGKADAEHPAAACEEPAATLRAKRDLLREELVRFAEKVLVIANHEVLLTQYAEKTGEPRAEIVDNIQVLQAVANSLLNQANELRFRQEHRTALADHLPGLQGALAETYAPDGRRTLALVVAQLAAERAEVSAGLAKIDAAAQAKAAELKAAEKDQKETADAATAKVEKLKKEAEAVTAGKVPDLATVAELDTAIQTVESLRLTWRERTDSAAGSAKPESPREVVSRLIRTLLPVQDSSKSTPRAENATTLKVLATRTFDFPTLGPPTPKAGELKDPRLALDQLLDSLRLLLAQQVQAGGSGSAAAIRTAQSIEVVEAQRAGLIYLRPASAYLRSSYPATSLQPGMDAKWKNTLARNFLRSIPLLGELRSPDEMRRLRVFAEIDRQSWQTVNTVRLEGAGSTNYAIAKDDIGNWYAKAYSADPKEIIKGAKSLAMYSMGMPAGVVSTAMKTAQASGTATPASPQQDALERLRARYAAQYEERTQKQAADLGALFKDDSADTLIRGAWTGDDAIAPFADDLEKALKAAKAEVKPEDQATALAKADAKTYGPCIRDGLKTLKRYALVLDAKLGDQDLSETVKNAYITAKGLEQDAEKEKKAADAFKTAKKKARDSARRILRNKLDTALAERRATVDEYSQALTFLGDALSEEPAAGATAE